MKHTGHSRSADGFILPLTCALLFGVSLVLAGGLGYAAFSTRLTGTHLAATRCRLAAQSALESAKVEVSQKFESYAKSASRNYVASFSSMLNNWFNSSATNSIGCGGDTTVFFYPTTIDDCSVNVYIHAIDRPHIVGMEVADVTIRATAALDSVHGIPVSRTLEERIRLGIGTSQVFNYAYFINNHGWFQGGGGRAYGDIRANGDMDLDGSCYVNGAVYAAANSELGVDGDINNTGRFYTPSQYKNSAPTRARPLGTSSDGGYVNPDPDGNGRRDDLYGNLSEDDQIDMPYIGELAIYKDLAAQEKGRVTQGGVTLVDQVFDGTGPSGLTDADAADKGCIVLIGTAANPIKINGPVVVSGDVLISGYVTGQGTIYAGRNIHILDNIKYVNPPIWNDKSTSVTNTAAVNNTKDMLGLSAKGNIVIGDYTQSSWMSGVGSYITTPWVHPYACDASDADIGYPSTFNGNYQAKDGGNQIIQKEVGLGTYHTEQTPVYDRRGRVTGYTATKVEDTELRYVNSPERRYYESCVIDDIIKKNAQNAITQIDAVLYNNHAIMGKVGTCSFNGALVCRDEALNYSGSITFNWDIRLYNAPNRSLPKGVLDPYVLSWREVAE